jgi:hypothetical protein
MQRLRIRSIAAEKDEMKMAADEQRAKAAWKDRETINETEFAKDGRITRAEVVHFKRFVVFAEVGTFGGQPKQFDVAATYRLEVNVRGNSCTIQRISGSGPTPYQLYNKISWRLEQYFWPGKGTYYRPIAAVEGDTHASEEAKKDAANLLCTLSDPVWFAGVLHDWKDREPFRVDSWV